VPMYVCQAKQCQCMYVRLNSANVCMSGSTVPMYVCQAQQCQCMYVRLNSANVRMGEFQHIKHSALTSEAMR
jgi:hypothetical protein